MTAEKISIENAKQDKLFYFVVSAVVWRESDGRCLILKRDEREKVHPGKFGVPGGKLEWGDFDLENPSRLNGNVLDFENMIEGLLKRETLEESGLEIESEIKYIDSLGFVRPDGIPAVLMRFAVKYKSGEVKLEKGAFTDFAWVNGEEVSNYQCIKGIDDGIIKAIELFK